MGRGKRGNAEKLNGGRGEKGFPVSVQVGKGAEHELVKQRDGEGHVAVGGAVDHAFLDEFGTNRAESVHCTLGAKYLD